jgi:hypothetical protein
VDVARAVADAQEVTGLSKVGGDWVITRDLAMVWVVAAEGSLDLEPGREHRAIDVDRKTLEVERSKAVADEVRSRYFSKMLSSLVGPFSVGV